MHRVDLVVHVGAHEAAVGIEELGANDFGKQTGEDKEHEAGDQVLYSDDLVIEREDVPLNEALRLGVDVVGEAAAGMYRCC